MLCRHCQRRKANRPRGLCWSCYYSPAADQYGPISKYGNRGAGNRNKEKVEHVGTPSEPTSAVPGTDEKIEVFARRAEQKVDLTHPFDTFDWSAYNQEDHVHRICRPLRRTYLYEEETRCPETP